MARFRRQVVAGLVVCGVIWASWVMNGYMQAAAPHWEQGQLHPAYYRESAIHGVEVHYGGLHEVAEDWAEAAGDYKVRTVLPVSIRPGRQP